MHPTFIKIIIHLVSIQACHILRGIEIFIIGRLKELIDQVNALNKIEHKQLSIMIYYE